MPDIRYESETEPQPHPARDRRTPALIRLVVRYSGGLVKDEQMAIRVLLCFAALMLLAAVAYPALSGPPPRETPPDTHHIRR